MNANENKLMTACKAGNHAKVKEILLESKKNIRNATDVLMEAVKNNDIEMVHVLLSDEEFAKWGNTYFALKFAVQHNYFQIVDMLLQHPKTDSYFVDYRLLNEAVNFNSIQSVQLLLTDGRANPDSHDGIVISTACSMGFTEILMMLLQDPRVTPDTMNFSKALLQAVNNNHSDIVDIVLKDGRANPNISNGIVIRTACSRGNTEILMLLLQDPRVDPAIAQSEALLEAVHNNHCDILEILLKDGRADPTVDDYEAVEIAANAQPFKLKCLSLLLNDYRIDPGMFDIERVNNAQVTRKYMKNVFAYYKKKHDTKKALISEIRTRGRTRKIRNNLMHTLWADPFVVARREGINLSRFSEATLQNNDSKNM